MIESMLFLACADHAQLALSPEQVDVRAELERIADYFEGPADQVGATIAVAGAGRAHADPVLLRRAVANLVDNAIRYARPDSIIRLDVSEETSATTIAVTNEGAGIASEDTPRIFDRFYRADGSRGGHDPRLGSVSPLSSPSWICMEEAWRFEVSLGHRRSFGSCFNGRSQSRKPTE